jgi:hypothetical protein
MIIFPALAGGVFERNGDYPAGGRKNLREGWKEALRYAAAAQPRPLCPRRRRRVGIQTREYVMKPLSQRPAESLFDQPAQR